MWIASPEGLHQHLIAGPLGQGSADHAVLVRQQHQPRSADQQLAQPLFRGASVRKKEKESKTTLGDVSSYIVLCVFTLVYSTPEERRGPGTVGCANTTAKSVLFLM